MATLLFIDTNILLDFYRVVGQKEALSILGHIDDNHEKIITGCQVEMEYKKNRQKTIIGCLTTFKGPDGNVANPPAFLSHSQAAAGIKKSRKEIQTRVTTLKRTADAILKNPSINDPVYKVCQRLFKNTSPLNLSRTNEIRFEIRELAEKRFRLGYPPRKDSDNSIGDAINWEWLVLCAKKTNSDIVIASRDSDYGVLQEKDSILNDWLTQEFKQRVGRNRKITLTPALTTAFKLANITVSKNEQKAESEFLNFDSTSALAITNPSKQMNSVLSSYQLGNFIELFKRIGTNINREDGQT